MISLDLKDRVLSGSHPSGQSKVSKVCHFLWNFPVQGAMLRPHHGAPSLYKGDGPCGFDFTSKGHSTPPVLGRLARPSLVQGGVPPSKGRSPGSLHRAGDLDQLREVPVVSDPGSHISRYHSQQYDFDGFPDGGETAEVCADCARISVLREAARVALEKDVVTPLFPDAAGARGTSSHENDPACSQETMEFSGGGDRSGLGRPVSPGPSMVDRARSVGTRVSSRCDSPGPNVLIRRLGRGLGSTLSRHRRFRPLVTNRSSSVHLSQRTNSSQVGAEALSPSFYRVRLSRFSPTVQPR